MSNEATQTKWDSVKRYKLKKMLNELSKISGHVSPEAIVGGPIAFIKNGDIIEIDVPKGKLSIQLTSSEIKKRRRTWKPIRPRYKSGALAKYSTLVQSASNGAITIPIIIR